MKIDWVPERVARMRGQIGAQEREIRILQRDGASTVSAEALLARMRAKVNGSCKRESLRRLSKAFVDGNDP